MKNNLKFLRRKSIGMALIGVLTFFTACDKGIDADEVFVPNVTNSTLESPKANLNGTCVGGRQLSSLQAPYSRYPSIE